MFVRAIWDKLPECIFKIYLIQIHEGNFEVFKRVFTRVIYPKSRPNQTWSLVITLNQQTLCIETDIFQQQSINYVNGAILIPIKRVIKRLITYYKERDTVLEKRILLSLKGFIGHSFNFTYTI